VLEEYPGACMLGPKAHKRLASRANEVVIDVDDPLESKESEDPPPPILEGDPESPDHDQEGFGLTKKYFNNWDKTQIDTDAINLIKSFVMGDKDTKPLEPPKYSKGSGQLEKSIRKTEP
jgi:hypothetical protein